MILRGSWIPVLGLSCLVASGANAQSLSERLASPSGEASEAPQQPLPSRPESRRGSRERATDAEAPTTAAHTARPDEPTTVAPAVRSGSTSTPPPDLVLTDDGGMTRGTIVRSEPSRSVTIQLATGETVEIPWSDVRFAGRVEEAPIRRGAIDGAEPRPDGRDTVRVRFVANQRMTLHRLGATTRMSASGHGYFLSGRSDHFARECTAPCELEIDPGVHRFGLSIGDRGPFPVRSIDVTGPGTLRGRHVDNAGIRAAGWVVFLIGLAGAAGMFSLGLATWRGEAWFAGAGVSGGLGLLVGIPMMAAGSGVVLEFE